MKNIFILLYSFFLLCLTIFSYSFIDPNLQYLKGLYTGFFSDHREIVSVVYILLVCLLFGFYFYFIWSIKHNKITTREIVNIISVVVVILFFSYPAMLSYDIFNYITTAKVTFFYHENPYVIMPIEFIGEPFLSFTHAANKTALYAPFWILLTGIPYFLSFGNFIIMLYGFKLLISVFYIATIVLLWKITKNSFSVAVFALNPLVIIETLVSGHNDIVMMFFACVSFYLLRQKKVILGIIAIIMSVFIKYVTIVLLPIFLYAMLLTIQKKKLEWKNVFIGCVGAMVFVFFLSPLREEIYPWYAIWFLTFASLSSSRLLLYSTVIFSFSLLFRYTPFMFTGNHFGLTPIIKIAITSVPITLTTFLFVFKRKIWLKDFF